MPARSAIAVALGAAIAVVLPIAAGAATPAADVVVAVTGVSGDATEDNGQQKLARAPDGTLFLIYSAPNQGAAPYAGSKYSAPGDEGEGVFVSRSDDD